ncbi:MAG: DNA repair protein [Paracoccaceae bacterium]
MKLPFLINFAQLFGLALLGVAALAMVLVTGLSSFGVWPWLDVTAAFGETLLPQAGMALQIGTTVLLVTLLTVIPASLRVMKLEHQHRRFSIDMDDVTRAYRAAHMADRAEMFGMQREFDAVRERYAYLKEKSDLSEIDDELLIIGAQMSEQSRDLAERFSDRRMARVRAGLKDRQDDISAMEDRVQAIKAAAVQLARMRDHTELSKEDLFDRAEALRAQITDIAHPAGTGGVLKFQRH